MNSDVRVPLLAKDRALGLSLTMLVIGALVAWPVSCSDVGLVLTLVLSGLATLATFSLLFTGGTVSALVSVLVAGALGMATVFVTAVIVAFVCSVPASLS